MSMFGRLSPRLQTQVLDAVAAVESSETPVPERSFQALLDPGLRACVAECLDNAGRVLVRTGHGYLSGYADDIADSLTEEGIGLLPPQERSVLTLVLLHCVAIPRARGRLTETSWSGGEPVLRGSLKHSQIPDGVVSRSLRLLAHRRLVRFTGQGQSHVCPGPALDRLTPAAQARLWEQLVLVADPRGTMAQVIRRRHSVGLSEDPPATFFSAAHSREEKSP
ncbi:hypothetical protein [Nocardiopsis dassonvillei]|uniref:hypothetical protein n=1 Tax=Nocardiopsis dassonvillei TaxID=2014 RepID=UPI00363EF395